ncbi:hypothetical protein TCAL_01730 [Tigriopus californicus]|uniref:G-protein coupled receptors family 1 profile domain-containing protein n=1 Tax=Tigriopus californicus TaxID=6832 RepID=A0A553PL14_TIGCA|nr:muscarinic acetylcholine receptor gar-3-like [Tigriopus californicus]TRY78349.1 hypothetical protein TCAL_01730 [Tigriopus californicus]
MDPTQLDVVSHVSPDSHYHQHFSSNNTTSVILGFEDEINPYTPLQASLIGISAGLLSFVTIAGNLMVMISFKLDKQLQTISNYFLFSLAVADIIIGLISMPLFTVFLIQQEWTFGVIVCDTWLSVDYLASNASVLNLLVISFDRYFSVTRPLTYRARRTTKKAALMIFSAWAVSAIVWPPWIFAWPYIEGNRTVPRNDCYIQFIYSNEYMSIVTVMIAFFVPVSVMIGLYVRVWWETVKRQRELVHLQAGKKVNSKRSDSSDETADEVLSRKGIRGNISSIGSNRSKESQEIAYAPNSLLKTRASANSLYAIHQRKSSCLGAILRLCSSCIDSDRGMGGEEASSEGYMTPRSIETPVQLTSKCPSLNLIRDPYATRFPILRPSASVEERLPCRQIQQGGGGGGGGGLHPSQIMERPPTSEDVGRPNENIYTILIRFPPAIKSHEKLTSNHDHHNNHNPQQPHQHQSLQYFPQQQPAVVKTPSIQILSGPTEDESLGLHSAHHPAYPRSLPMARRFDSDPTHPHHQYHQHPQQVPSGHRHASHHAERAGFHSASGSISRSRTSSSDAQSRAKHYRQSSHDTALNKLPPDTKLVPRQLVRASEGGVAVGANPGSHSSLPSALGSSRSTKPHQPVTKVKKATSEKKQDRKAAKTLSAILLAFIVTWTPYSVLVVLNAILGKQLADKYIPDILWQFSYYLCYINSTVNPVLYALCNAAFRRTYVRILTCRWGSRARQPINRYYYG